MAVAPAVRVADVGAAPVARAADAVAAPALRVAHLTKRFPVRRGLVATLRAPRARAHLTVLDDVSCVVRRGEFFGLLGPNGAGKTTLLRTLAGALEPDAGEAAVHGLDVVRQAAAVRRLVGCATGGERSLYWRISARENLRLYAALQRLRGAAAERRIAELLRLFDLERAGERMVGQFSSGMRQRLLIARALLPRPAVLLLDEPTRSLDPVSARDFRVFLRTTLPSEQACTIVLATHSREEALDLCDRVAVLDRGRLLAVGTPAELQRCHGDDRWTLWTTAPAHPLLQRLVAEGAITLSRVEAPEADGWTPLRLEMAGGREAAARLLARLAAGGVPTAGLQPVELPLADLLDRIVAAREHA